jgi:flagellar biogenesis protein FliO
MLDKLFTFLGKALSENENEPSAMRVNVFYIVVSLVTVIALGFVAVVFWYKEFITTYLTIIVGLVVTALGAKYLQRVKE